MADATDVFTKTDFMAGKKIRFNEAFFRKYRYLQKITDVYDPDSAVSHPEICK
jgi:hypothetical protein